MKQRPRNAASPTTGVQASERVSTRRALSESRITLFLLSAFDVIRTFFPDRLYSPPQPGGVIRSVASISLNVVDSFPFAEIFRVISSTFL